MKITVRQLVWWDVAKECALATIGKKPITPMPSKEWIAKALLSQHSPIRAVQYLITLEDIPYAMMGHFVRHKIGFEPFVCTSREDRTGVPRNERSQMDLVSMKVLINAQGLINVSKKRLCNKADSLTKQIWLGVRSEIRKTDPILADKMQPQCVSDGCQCREFEPCGFHKSNACKKEAETLNNTDYEHSDDK